ncbi:MAG: hypothetical protein QQW96_03775 [Tychonema bourrellyi B0820]|nr:hypothetical protein [Tychonema bourrellyi B0820]
MELLSSDAITESEQINSTVNWKPSDIMLADSIGQLIDLNEIADRLLATDCQQCSLFNHEEVKLAFLRWVQEHIDSIAEQPEWFLGKDPKNFNRNLPFDKLQEDYDDGFPEMSDDELQIMQKQMDSDYNSALEDDFDGTPEEAAESATYW